MLRDLIIAFAQLFDLLVQLYIYVVIGRAIISWVNPDPYNPIVRFLYNATEPVFYRIRRVIPLVFSGIDLTPMALIFFLYFFKQIVLSALVRFANSLL